MTFVCCLFVLRFCMQIVMLEVLPSQTKRPQNNLSLMCISKQKTLFKTMKFQICLLIFSLPMSFSRSLAVIRNRNLIFQQVLSSWNSRYKLPALQSYCDDFLKDFTVKNAWEIAHLFLFNLVFSRAGEWRNVYFLKKGKYQLFFPF